MQRARLASVLAVAAVAGALAAPGNGSVARAFTPTNDPIAPSLFAPHADSKVAATPAIKLAQAVASTNAESDAGAAPAAAVEPTIADKLRGLFSAPSKLDRIIGRKSDRAAIEAFYQKRNHAPFWIDQSTQNARAQAAIAYLKTIDADGLDPADYPLPNLAATNLDALAEAELKFTATILAYARHAMNGRVHWSRISANIYYKDSNYDPADVLNKLADSSDIAQTLDALNPPQPGYKTLKAKLAELRQQKGDDGVRRIPHGPVLKLVKEKAVKQKGKAKEKAAEKEIVMQDARVPLLRERLGLPAQDNTNYDQALVDAVTKFQKQHNLPANGQLTAATVDALNGPTREGRIAIILANLERWRWMPRDLGKVHVLLNIPEFHLRVMKDGALVWKTRVVVGKPSQATPLLTETMKFITVNPTWNVPQSIVYNELLPIYETSDPSIFERMGLKVEATRDGVRVYQPPGDKNALGRIRFNFPNKFLVYQHDTPEKHLFEREVRAYSHGCMRVQDPVRYAEVLLSFAMPNERYTQERIRKMFGEQERQIDFAVQIPVHLTYQTAFVDEDGALQFRSDIYGLDVAILNAFKGNERRVADVAIERPADPNYKPSPVDVERLDRVAGGGGWGPGWGRGSRARTAEDPFSFLSRLFR